MLNAQIAKTLGCSRSQVTKLLKHWFESRGLKMPDGRSRRGTLKVKHLTPPLFEQISDDVKRLCDDGLLLGEIAKELSCDINTITKAIAHWHESRDLPVPDGRTRRKSLTRKVSRPRKFEADGEDPEAES